MLVLLIIFFWKGELTLKMFVCFFSQNKKIPVWHTSLYFHSCPVHSKQTPHTPTPGRLYSGYTQHTKFPPNTNSIFQNHLKLLCFAGKKSDYTCAVNLFKRSASLCPYHKNAFIWFQRLEHKKQPVHMESLIFVNKVCILLLCHSRQASRIRTYVGFYNIKAPGC